MDKQQETITALQVQGMTCTNCALGVRKFLEKKGLKDIDVSFAESSASFVTKKGLNISSLAIELSELGFPSKELKLDNEEAAHDHDHSNIVPKLLVSAAFSLPLLLAMIPGLDFLKLPLVQLLLCIPVMIIGWDHFGRSAWSSLKMGVPNMDVLIVIGISAAFFYSLAGFVMGLGPDYLFFETAASIVALVLLGNYLEHRSVAKTTTAIKELSKLRPKRAKLLINNSRGGDAKIREISAKDIQSGDLLLVNSGEQIPVDGMVAWGNAQLDEAIITGESEWVVKNIGDSVTGATWLMDGSLHIEATKVGVDSTIAQIISLVRKAQSDKPKLQRLADRISAVFVPTVLLIALFTFIGNMAFGTGLQAAILRAVAVLVVACPCAMGLATPTAVMVGVGRAAFNGILFKGAAVIETLAKAQHIVFDKTGTLTTGKFKIDSSRSAIDRGLFRSILMTLEQHSSHPLAKSIVQQLGKQEAFPMVEVKEMKGIGVMGKDAEGNTYSAGSYKLVNELTDDSSHNIYVSKNKELLGWIDMNDELKENAADAVNSLKRTGLQLHLLSGDKEDKTKIIAQQVGLDKAHWSQLPDEKLARIAELKEDGITVMVGDGVNDAPALEKADVGVSLGDATEIAIKSADVILLNGDIRQLSKAISLSKATLTTIKQNLFWAFFYNILMIPLAAVGLLSPMIAAAAMAFSDVIVIGNSLRLRKKKLD